ncbi:MAG: diaminopimelate epimerase [Candidatus Eremiobacteraeota bacterium]|nr:diaminopimelate epimerase [Candidatus Eremiobacteraeota bacterium]
MSAVPVTKMHGSYNDFIVLDERIPRISNLALFAKTVCDRRGSVGADGVLVIGQSDRGDARMSIFNADGSQAEMCGNGARCVARYLSERGAADDLVLDTSSGAVKTSIISRNPFEVRVNMGNLRIETMNLPHYDALCVWAGNPHVILFEKGLDDIDLPAAADRLVRTGQFPGGINVHVAVKAGPNRLLVRHYERGVGVTMACGTGAVASAAAAVQRELVLSPVQVDVPGGRLVVEWSGKGDAFLSGPAVRVFETEIDVELK